MRYLVQLAGYPGISRNLKPILTIGLSYKAEGAIYVLMLDYKAKDLMLNGNELSCLGVRDRREVTEM